MVQRQQNANVQQHIENQAYFTAMSVNRMVMNWLNGSEFSFVEGDDGTEEAAADSPQGRFILEILNQPVNTPIPIKIDTISAPSDLGDVLGSFEIYVSRDENNIITFRTEAEFFDQTASVSGTMRYQTDKWLEGGGYAEGIQKIRVPVAPLLTDEQFIRFPKPETDPDNPADEYLPISDSSTIDWTTFSEYSSGNGNISNNYKITGINSGVNLAGLNANILVVGSEKNSGRNFTITPPDNKTSITLMIVKKGATVQLESNGARFDEIIIEDGGTIEITKSNLGVLPINATKRFNERLEDGTLTYDLAPIVYIKAGGQMRIASGVGGNITPNFTAYVFANPTPPPNRAAISFASGKINFRSVIVQPFNSDPPTNPDTGALLFPPSWPADIGDMSGILFSSNAYRIHLPIGYGGFNTDQAGLLGLPDSILINSCNHRGPAGQVNSNLRSKPPRAPNPPIPGYSWIEDPFCPHFLALYEPPYTVGRTAWWIDHYEEG